MDKITFKTEIEHDGLTMTAKEWAASVGILTDTFVKKLNTMNGDIGGTIAYYKDPHRLEKLITVNGETHTRSEWIRIYGNKPEIIRNRVAHGMPFEEAKHYKRVMKTLNTAKGNHRVDIANRKVNRVLYGGDVDETRERLLGKVKDEIYYRVAYTEKTASCSRTVEAVIPKSELFKFTKAHLSTRVIGIENTD